MNEKKNIFGIIAIIAAFISPLLGVVLALIALVRKEKTVWLSIIALIISGFNFLLAFVILSNL